VRTRTFQTEHRDLEVQLDELLLVFGSSSEIVARFRAAHAAAAAHYSREDEYFRSLLAKLPIPVHKMLGQHAEVLEIGGQAENSLEIGQMADAVALIRRFHAIAQHNIIEEERDVFPLLRCSPPREAAGDTIAS
jgi:hypothetical protein